MINRHFNKYLGYSYSLRRVVLDIDSLISLDVSSGVEGMTFVKAGLTECLETLETLRVSMNTQVSLTLCSKNLELAKSIRQGLVDSVAVPGVNVEISSLNLKDVLMPDLLESQKAVLAKYLIDGKENSWQEVAQRVCEYVALAELPKPVKDSIIQEVKDREALAKSIGDKARYNQRVNLDLIPDEYKENYYFWFDNFYSIIEPMKFMPGGSILNNADFGLRSLLNCFVLNTEDNMGDITQVVSDSVMTTKFRGGVGINIGSKGQRGYIRERNTPFSSGVALGPCSVLDMVSSNSATITYGNKQRRGAFMFSMDWRHGDIWEFIQAKTQSTIDAVSTRASLDELYSSVDLLAALDSAIIKLQSDLLTAKLTGESTQKLQSELTSLLSDREKVLARKTASQEGFKESWIETHLSSTGKRVRRWYNANISVQLDDDFFEYLDRSERGLVTTKIAELKQEAESLGLKFVPKGDKSAYFYISKKIEELGVLSDDSFYRELKTRYLWESIAIFAKHTADPGCLFLSNAKKRSPIRNFITTTNPCFAPGTMIVTRQGHFPIESLVGKEVEVWDGDKWVLVDNFRVTAENQEVFKVTLSSGASIKATAYHSFILEDGSRKQLKDLVVSDVLKKHDVVVDELVPLAGTEITSIESAGVEPKVYCCTVPETHAVSLSCGVILGQCGEIWLPPNSACNLGSIVMSKFVKIVSEALCKDGEDCTHEYRFRMDGKSAEIDIEDLKRTVRIGTRFLDDVLDVSFFATELQRFNVQERFRQLGLGIIGWADFLKLCHVSYTDQATHFDEIDFWGGLIANEAYRASEALAVERGPCGVWEDIKTVVTGNPFENWTNYAFDPHPAGKFRYTSRLESDIKPNDKDREYLTLDTLGEVLSIDLGNGSGWDGGSTKVYQVPRRNSTVLSIAPTGSIAQLAASSWAFEPDFGLSIWKQVFVDATKQQQQWVKMLSPYLEELNLAEPDKQVVLDTGSLTGTQFAKQFPERAAVYAIAREVSPEMHIKTQGRWQKWIDSSLSKTANLPASTTVEDIMETYRLSVAEGLKGVTVYCEGTLESEPVQVGARKVDEVLKLSTDKPLPDLLRDSLAAFEFAVDTHVKEIEETYQKPLRERPDVMQSISRRFRTDVWGDIYVDVAYDNEGPRELKVTVGKSGGETMSFCDGLGRIVSLALKYHVPIEDITRQLAGIRGPMPSGFGPKQLLSIPDAVAKALMELPPTLGQLDVLAYPPKAPSLPSGFGPKLPKDSKPAELGILPEKIWFPPLTEQEAKVARLSESLSGFKLCPGCGSDSLSKGNGCSESCNVCGYSSCS